MSEDIRSIGTINRLITYFSKVLDWQIDEDDFEDIEDISYDFEAEDLGLKEEAFARIKSLRQLQPLVDGQKWGIFSIEFDSKKFEVTALRKVLSGLIPKKRNSADHAVWDQKDLLFLCFWGEDSNRTIGIAHFEDKEKGLPQIKMIYCAPAIEDTMQIRQFEVRLKSLSWPLDVHDIQKWHDDWSSAFSTGYRQIIHDASTLTLQLAVEARGIRDRILETLEVETDNGYVHQLYGKFKDTLIHDMTEVQFADMYAQTVVYGLFSARCMDESQDDFSATEAVDCIPNTNPFLKSLMKECLGAQNNSKLSYDELEIGNVVDLLLHTKTDAIIQDFNRQTGGGREDPVIHFYEEFLTAYDKNQKVQRGVYYTPQPVVDFIVRAVDSIIKREFGLQDGLASSEKKKIKYIRDSKKKIDGLYRTKVEDIKEVPAVQILDPSTGTGTFLRQTILQIYKNFKETCDENRLNSAWNEYVVKNLLPRLNGFELMMAPYAVAHMKLAIVLKNTGYNFSELARLNVYLTNTLEKPGKSDMQISLWDDPLATESIEANSVKKNGAINVVIGNPPYKADSLNKDEWIMNLMEDYKKEPGTNERLKEKNPKVVNDDYVKFIRYAQELVKDNKEAVVAYINPHSFTDNLTFRGMRWELLNKFDEIYVLDLHGNVMSHEVLDTDERDENVFDIQQGVSINLFVKNGKKGRQELADVYYADVAGSRLHKYDFLNTTELYDIAWQKVQYNHPYYFFKPKDLSESKSYEDGIRLDELFPCNVVGIKTSDDAHLVSFNKFETEYDQLYDYRPFDIRHINYDLSKVERHRNEVMRHFVGHDNYGLVINRQVVTDNWSHVQIVKNMIDSRLHYSRKGNPVVCPLFIYDSNKKKTNVDPKQVMRFEEAVGIPFSEDIDDSENRFDGLDLFDYAYAILLSKAYQEKYINLLNIDFPRIPLPSTKEMFFELVKYGKKLRKHHLFEEPIDNTLKIVFCGEGDNIINAISLKNNCLYINKTQYFTNITDEIWEIPFGGYHSLQKWFKDRKNRAIDENDVSHIVNVFNMLWITKDIVGELDQKLISYGIV